MLRSANAELTRQPMFRTADYDIIATVIEQISTDWRDQPSLDDLARMAGIEPDRVAKTVHPLGRPVAQGIFAGRDA